MKRAQKVLLAATVAFAACHHDDDDDALPPRAATVPNAPGEVLPTTGSTAISPQPSTNDCQSACAHLEVVGPTALLANESDRSARDAAVAFGDGRWYVAWGTRDGVMWLQRFDAGGAVDGAAKKIFGLSPLGLVWRSAPADLVLHGRVWINDMSRGTEEMIQRFDPALRPLGDAIRVRSPYQVSELGYAMELEDDDVVLSHLHRRSVISLRDVRLSPSLGPDQTPVSRQWFFPRSKDVPAPAVTLPVRVGAKRLVAYIEKTGVDVASLEANGALGPGSRVIDFDREYLDEYGVKVWSRVIGGTWWVAVARSSEGGATLHLRAVDPVSLQTQKAFDLRFPYRAPLDLIDTNGSPTVVANIEYQSNKVWFIPIDVTKGAACRPLSLLTEERNRSVIAYRFAGDSAGVVIEDELDEPRPLQFARLACRP